MTMEIKDQFTIKSKRKEHPNARKYPGRPSMEFGTGLRKFMGELTAAERQEFLEGKLVFEEAVSAEFFDNILVGDVVGLGVLCGINEMGSNTYNEPAAYKFKILEINRTKDTMRARNITWEDAKRDKEYQGEEVDLAFEDFSSALGMGFGEILERDGKPYGVSEDIELKIKIVDMSGSQQTGASAAPQLPATTPETPEPTAPTTKIP